MSENSGSRLVGRVATTWAHGLMATAVVTRLNFHRWELAVKDAMSGDELLVAPVAYVELGHDEQAFAQFVIEPQKLELTEDKVLVLVLRCQDNVFMKETVEFSASVVSFVSPRYFFPFE